jgi:hypothetical protein
MVAIMDYRTERVSVILLHKQTANVSTSGCGSGNGVDGCKSAAETASSEFSG